MIRPELALLFCLGALAGLPTHATATPDLNVTRQLVLDGRYESAYAELTPLVAEQAGAIAFDYLYGVAALETGRAVEAILAFERVLDQEPDNVEARAFLARALFEAGEADSARAEFERVRSSTGSASLERDVERYLAVITRGLDRHRTRYALYFETGTGYDSNIANATDERFVALPALGGVLVELSPDSRENASALWQIAGGGSFATPLGNAWSLLGGAGLRHRLAVQESDFRQFTAHGDLGLEWRIDGDDTLRVGASAQRFDVGGERNRELAGATLQWQRAVNRRTQVTAFGQYAALRFPEQQLRDVNRYTIGLGFGHAVAGRGNPVLFASVYGGFEDATRVAANQVSRTLVGTRLGGELALTTRWSAYGILNYQYSDYDGREPLFGRARREHYVDLAGGLRYRIQDGWSLTPQLLWAHNDANLPLFEYDRWEATLTLRNDF